MPNIEFLFEHSAPYIEFFGDKGYERFCAGLFDRKEGCDFVDGLTYDDADKLAVEVLLKKLIAGEDDEIKESSPALVKILLRTFVDMERSGGAPEKLKEWVYNCLDKISGGDDPIAVFKLKSSKRGKKSSFNPLDLKVACKFELLRRAGHSFESAQFECAEEFTITERTAARIVKRTELPSNVSDKLLDTYSRIDTTSFFNP